MQPNEKRPRISARGLVMNSRNELLLVNAHKWFQDESWCTPGGGIDVFETSDKAAVREVFEETGLRVKAVDIFAISEFFFMDKGHHQIDIHWRCQIIGNEDINEDWTDPDNIVTKRGFFSAEQARTAKIFPVFLRDGEWADPNYNGPVYRGLEVKEEGKG